MRRLWLVLLLSLSLWPAPAAASPGVRDAGPDVLRRPVLEDAQAVFRSTGGIELLGVLDARLSTGGSGGGSNGDPGGGSRLSSGIRRISPHVRLPVRATAEEAFDACAPLCERLPYHATAPPSLR